MTCRTSIQTSAFQKALKQVKTRRIIGIDPGLASTGWGIIDYSNGKIHYIDHGSIETSSDTARASRLFFIHDSIRQIIIDYKPTEAAIETLYFGRNISSAIPVAESRGVISAVLAGQGLIIHDFTPNAIKQGVTGQSRADKSQIQYMVRIILGLEEIPKPDHAADALAAAICAANKSII